MINLGGFGGNSVGYYSRANAINDSGQVVGYAYTPGGVSHAFVYSGGILTDLNSFLPAGSEWELNNATAINDAGQIVGYGTIGTSDIRTHAFLLDLNGSATPEPLSFVLAAAGLASFWFLRPKSTGLGG